MIIDGQSPNNEAFPGDSREDLWGPEGLLGRLGDFDGDDETIAAIAERREPLFFEAHESDWTGNAAAEYLSLGRAESIIKRCGVTGMRREIELQQESLAPLPAGYVYDNSLVINTSELNGLRRLIGYSTDQTAIFERVIDDLKMGNFNVGVRSVEKGDLIGYGRLVYQRP